MANPNLHIIDDGTMDTVVACAGCDWEGRYNPEEIVGRAPSDNSEHAMEMQRVADALELAGGDHDCGEPDGPLLGPALVNQVESAMVDAGMSDSYDDLAGDIG